MVERPILSAIRAILKFQDTASIAQVAKMSGASQRLVLDVLNANGQFVHRYRSNGKIARVSPEAALRDQLWAGGSFYRVSQYDRHLEFTGNDELRQRIGTTIYDLHSKVVQNTPANIAELEAAGLRPWSEAVIDDRLWNEEAVDA